MIQTLHFYWATWQKRRRGKSPDRFGSCIFPVSLKTKFIGGFNLWPAGDSFTTAPMRSSTAHNGMRDHNNVPESTKTRTVLAVAPLNSVPYIGPSTGYSPMSANRANDNAEKGGPAMIFLPSESAQEWDNLVAQTKTGVALTGSAAMGNIGPAIGLVDIAESDDSYYFRVSLPGVSRDEKDFSCDIEPDGKILIKGATTTGEKTVCKHSQVFKMQTQNLCPPGHFTMSFQLPGPVNNEEFNGHFGSDGVLEGHVKKPSTELSSKADREQN